MDREKIEDAITRVIKSRVAFMGKLEEELIEELTEEIEEANDG